MATKELDLTAKQIRFCEEYLIDLNGTQAAIRAGYSRNSAGQIAEQNLKKLEIQSYLSKRQEELQKATGITQKRVLEEYAKIAFSDLRNFFTVDGALKPIRELDDVSAAALSSIEVYEEKVSDPGEDEVVVAGQVKKIKIWDKVKALESLGRHLGLFEKDNEQSKAVIPIIGMRIINGKRTRD